jgi:hypothetical protein
MTLALFFVLVNGKETPVLNNNCGVHDTFTTNDVLSARDRLTCTRDRVTLSKVCGADEQFGSGNDSRRNDVDPVVVLCRAGALKVVGLRYIGRANEPEGPAPWGRWRMRQCLASPSPRSDPDTRTVPS